MTTIAMIVAWAMGSAIARRLTQNGATVLRRLAGRSERNHALAAEVGMADASFDELAGAAIVLSVVPPGAAPAVVEELAPLFALPDAPVFCDGNAYNLQSKQRLSARDVAILAQFGIDARVLDGPLGAAAASRCATVGSTRAASLL